MGMNDLYSPFAGGVCTTRTILLDSVGLDDCQATVTCQTETVGTNNYFTLTSTGTCSINGRVMAQRQIVVRTQP